MNPSSQQRRDHDRWVHYTTLNIYCKHTFDFWQKNAVSCEAAQVMNKADFRRFLELKTAALYYLIFCNSFKRNRRKIGRKWEQAIACSPHGIMFL